MSGGFAPGRGISRSKRSEERVMAGARPGKVMDFWHAGQGIFLPEYWSLYSMFCPQWGHANLWVFIFTACSRSKLQFAARLRQAAMSRRQKAVFAKISHEERFVENSVFCWFSERAGVNYKSEVEVLFFGRNLPGCFAG